MNHVSRSPHHVSGSPHHVGGSPHHIGGTPHQVGGSLHHVGGSLRHVGGSPLLDWRLRSGLVFTFLPQHAEFHPVAQTLLNRKKVLGRHQLIFSLFCEIRGCRSQTSCFTMGLLRVTNSLGNSLGCLEVLTGTLLDSNSIRSKPFLTLEILFGGKRCLFLYVSGDSI